jgi:hypothetical protein
MKNLINYSVHLVIKSNIAMIGETCVGEMRYAYKTRAGKPERKRSLEKFGVGGRIISNLS